jgi:hypothetical protein
VDYQRVNLEPHPALADALEQDALGEEAHASFEVELPTIGPLDGLDRLGISRQQRAAKAVLLIGDGLAQIGVVWPGHAALRVVSRRERSVWREQTPVGVRIIRHDYCDILPTPRSCSHGHAGANIGSWYARRVSIFDSDAFNDRLFFPRPHASPPPAGASDRMVEVDGARLHVRLHAAPAASGTLLLFHGNGEVVADYDRTAARFAQAGVALAVMDYRGYGRSTGTPTLRTLISDARRVAEVIRPDVVMGRSLGGVAAHELYARPTEGMEGVILESALFDLDSLIRRRDLIPPASFTQDERATFEPATKLALGRLPLLVLHGARDELIAPSEAKSALAAAGTAAADKALVLVPRRGHNDLSGEDSYWRALAEFVTRCPT